MDGWEVLSWKEDALLLIDQRMIPKAVKYVQAATYRDVIFSIKEMVVRGAPAIGVTAAFGVYLAAKEFQGLPDDAFFSNMERACQEIRCSRPTAVNLFWALDRMKKRLYLLQGEDREQLLALLLKEAHAIDQENCQLNRDIATYGSAVVGDRASILTHCNTGALATVCHGTALGVIREAVFQGKEIRVYATETRPRFQGARLTAWELMQDGIDVTVMVDSASAPLIRDKKVDLILVGADCIAQNGDVANKIGTYMLSEMAVKHRVPFYAVAPTTTFDFSIQSGKEIPIEERDPREITHVGCEAVTPEGVAVYNPAFDVTPAENITGIITEKGILYPPFHACIPALYSS